MYACMLLRYMCKNPKCLGAHSRLHGPCPETAPRAAAWVGGTATDPIDFLELRVRPEPKHKLQSWSNFVLETWQQDINCSLSLIIRQLKAFQYPRPERRRPAGPSPHCPGTGPQPDRGRGYCSCQIYRIWSLLTPINNWPGVDIIL